jgi:hypothetical protein
MESNRFIKDISKFELRDIIDAMSHQVMHLENSQSELLQALEVDPDDVDFSTAYKENIVALQKKKQTIHEFKAYLKEIDFAYYLDHYKEPLAVEPAPETSTTTITTTDVIEESGIYL